MDVLFIVISIGGVVFLGLLAWWIHTNADYQTQPPPKTPEDLDQDAALLRAKKRHAEALIEFALKEAELEDTRNFLMTRNQKR